MTKMAAMLKNVPNLKKVFFTKTTKPINCLETWYVASGSIVLQSLYKSWPWVDLALFYDKVNLVPLGIWMGKADFFFFHFPVVILL